MDGLLTLGLVSMGGKMMNKIVDACSTPATASSSTAGSESFDRVLKSEMGPVSPRYAGMDASELKTNISELEGMLNGQDDVAGFVGTDESYTVRRQNGGFVLEKEDGTIWRIPSDSETADIARNLCDAHRALSRLEEADGDVYDNGWIVNVEEA